MKQFFGESDAEAGEEWIDLTSPFEGGNREDVEGRSEMCKYIEYGEIRLLLLATFMMVLINLGLPPFHTHNTLKRNSDAPCHLRLHSLISVNQ